VKHLKDEAKRLKDEAKRLKDKANRLGNDKVKREILTPFPPSFAFLEAERLKNETKTLGFSSMSLEEGIEKVRADRPEITCDFCPRHISFSGPVGIDPAVQQGHFKPVVVQELAFEFDTGILYLVRQSHTTFLFVHFPGES